MTGIGALLRSLGCLLMDHAPIVVRCGDDSVLQCERCHKMLEMFVAGLYRPKDQKLDEVFDEKSEIGLHS